jgi:acyl-CoA synthetase (AMP-forming)/AMP-acid ligase II
MDEHYWEEDFITIGDRKRDMIIAGGYNIYPQEIGEILFEHPRSRKPAPSGFPIPIAGKR